MIRSLACLSLVLAALLAPPLPARAAEDYDNCTGFVDSLPAVISTQGTWCLRADLSTAITSGHAIEITTNNVTLDCNDFKLGGLAAGRGTLARGVQATGRFNISVRNCRIRGFRIGVSLLGSGAGHVVEDNHVEGSTSLGMFIVGAGSVVRRNRIVDSGGSTVSAVPVEAGLHVVNGVDVVANRVSGVRVFPIEGINGVIPRAAAGINAVNNAGGSIIGNRISGVLPVGSERGFGIRNFATEGPATSIVSGNILMGSRLQAIDDAAIACAGNGEPDAVSVDNVLIGFDIAIQGCSVGNNSVNSN